MSATDLSAAPASAGTQPAPAALRPAPPSASDDLNASRPDASRCPDGDHHRHIPTGVAATKAYRRARPVC